MHETRANWVYSQHYCSYLDCIGLQVATVEQLSALHLTVGAVRR